MQVRNDWKDAVAATLLVVTGDRSGTVEHNKANPNAALLRLLNDSRVKLGDVFVGRPSCVPT